MFKFILISATIILIVYAVRKNAARRGGSGNSNHIPWDSSNTFSGSYDNNSLWISNSNIDSSGSNDCNNNDFSSGCSSDFSGGGSCDCGSGSGSDTNNS